MSEFVVEEEPDPLPYRRSWLDKNFGRQDDDYAGLIFSLAMLQSRDDVDIDIQARKVATHNREAYYESIKRTLPSEGRPGHKVEASLGEDRQRQVRHVGGGVLTRIFHFKPSISSEVL